MVFWFIVYIINRRLTHSCNKGVNKHTSRYVCIWDDSILMVVIKKRLSTFPID